MDGIHLIREIYSSCSLQNFKSDLSKGGSGAKKGLCNSSQLMFPFVHKNVICTGRHILSSSQDFLSTRCLILHNGSNSGLHAAFLHSIKC